jgi:hypothetical protein
MTKIKPPALAITDVLPACIDHPLGLELVI